MNSTKETACSFSGRSSIKTGLFHLTISSAVPIISNFLTLDKETNRDYIINNYNIKQQNTKKRPPKNNHLYYTPKLTNLHQPALWGNKVCNIT